MLWLLWIFASIRLVESCGSVVSQSALLLLQRPPDRGFAAVVLARQLCHGLAATITLGNTPALAGIEDSWAAKLSAFAFRAFDAFLTALPDQFALELRDTAQHSN